MSNENKIISMTVPIKITKIDGSGVTYSHLISPEHIIKTLLNLLAIGGIRSDADKAQFKLDSHVDYDEKNITFFYERNNHDVIEPNEIDQPLFEHTHKVVGSVIDTINTINQHFAKGKILILEFDPSINQDFEILGSSVKYKDKLAGSVIHDILKIMPILQAGTTLKSNGITIPINVEIEAAPIIKTQKSLSDDIKIDGKIAGTLSIPERHIKIQPTNPSYEKQICDYPITKHCLNFNKIRLLPEKSQVIIELVKSSSTLQYNIDNFKVINVIDTNIDLFANLEI